MTPRGGRTATGPKTGWAERTTRHGADDLRTVRPCAVRHRFYPPNVSVNSEASPAELSRLFVAGHAAALVKATAAAGKVSNAKYQETLKKIEADARTALDAVKGQASEATALLAQPTDANARKLVDAIASKDLSPQVGGLLPAKNTYK